jgi:hypothetical protein
MISSFATAAIRRVKADHARHDPQAYNVPSPNEMVVDTGDYVGVDHDPEKEPVAIISPDSLEQQADQLQDLPLANDRTFRTQTPTCTDSCGIGEET